MRRSTSSAPDGLGAAGLARLLQLASPALPVGAYTYSQGLEWAVESGAAVDEASALDWIAGVLVFSIACYETPLLAAQMRAWRNGDHAEIRRLNAEFIASRETAELRAETIQMGYSLMRLLSDMAVADEAARRELADETEIAMPTAWSLAAVRWQVPVHAALVAYLWSWLENQVMAAVKAIPLGQTAGQRLLFVLSTRLDELAGRAARLPEAEWANMTPGLAIASARHETQYSRLFRS